MGYPKKVKQTEEKTIAGTPAWNDPGQGDGKDYPKGTDGYHSGLEEKKVPDYSGLDAQQTDVMTRAEEIADTHSAVPDHDHKWRPGVLSNQKKVNICTICGETQDA